MMIGQFRTIQTSSNVRCESSFKDKEELKEQWIKVVDLFSKTCKQCCVGVSSKGLNEVYPDDPKHEGHEWNVIQNKCHECVLYLYIKPNSKNPHD